MRTIEQIRADNVRTHASADRDELHHLLAIAEAADAFARTPTGNRRMCAVWEKCDSARAAGLFGDGEITLQDIAESRPQKQGDER